jgi:PAS domain S-box-containing protein
VSLINQAGCRLLGYSEARILGKNWFDHFLPGSVREHCRKIFVQLMEGIVGPVDCVENIVLTREADSVWSLEISFNFSLFHCGPAHF